MPTLEHTPRTFFDTSKITIPPYAESRVWQRNKRKVGEHMVKAVRFISWLNEDTTPQQIEQLLQHDDWSYEEALETNGLLFYDAAEIGAKSFGSGEAKPLGVSGLDIEYNENSCGWSSEQASVIAFHGLKHMAAKKWALQEDIYKEVYIEVLKSTYMGDGEYEFEQQKVLTKTDIMKHAGMHAS